VIDDTSGQTLAYVTTAGHDVKGSLAEKAAWVGKEIAKKAKTKKLKSLAFDRGSRLYKRRLSAVAEAARAAGLEV
jgi:large subunit ribosomal protein L18